MSLIHLGHDDVEREFVAVHYGGEPLPAFPWGQARFDAAVIIDSPLPSRLLARLPRELVSLNVDWISTVGTQAEELHDAIDDASVLVGRQRAAGDGDLMTSWHEEASDPIAYAEAATLLGGQDHVLVLFSGETDRFETLIFEIRRRLTRRSS